MAGHDTYPSENCNRSWEELSAISRETIVPFAPCHDDVDKMSMLSQMTLFAKTPDPIRRYPMQL